ncbi:major facilitator superfamily domain-containing protein [Umbelopsis sp. PMI_123]|nr:major facilitator superfamily domain-containing protein [Umbelopsis sp. PMI_123]
MLIRSDESMLLLNPQRMAASKRWFVLASFCLFSFTNALQWIAFSPAIQTFAKYFFDKVSLTTTNAINAFSGSYMIIYPILVPFSFSYFEDEEGAKFGSGLKRGITIGALLNAIAGVVRWIGAYPSWQGYTIVFLGQVIAAIAQVYMLALPPRLAVAWFPPDEINFITAIAVSFNNLGIAAGFALTPILVPGTGSMMTDIPRFLALQMVLCVIAFIAVWFAFQQEPSQDYQRINSEEDPSSQNAFSKQEAIVLFKQRNFITLLISFGMVMGAQCAVFSLLAEILSPSFDLEDNIAIGWLGSVMLLVGVPPSLLIGKLIDVTHGYMTICRILYGSVIVSVICLTWAAWIGWFTLAVGACLIFGIASSAILPAVFQWAGELFYPVNEVVPTGYLCMTGNIGGWLLVLIMGWTEDSSIQFTMLPAMVILIASLLIGMIATFLTNGQLKRLASQQYSIVESRIDA